jgi:hypothetical protein
MTKICFTPLLTRPHGCQGCQKIQTTKLKSILVSWSANTVTESADFGFILLFWLPQGPQGCLEKQNHPLSSNLVVWCAKIGLKSLNDWKTSEITRKTTKNYGFLTVFWSFWVLGPILVHQTAKFELSGQFCFSRHLWGPWGHQNSGVICIWKIFQLFFGWWRRLAEKNVFLKLKPDVTFIILHA